MKRYVRVIALICALMMLLSLAACGGDTKETEAPTEESAVELTDFGWVKFEMPEGWVDAEESPAYITVREETDSHHVVKLFAYDYVTGESVERIAEEDVAGDPDRYTLDKAVEIGERTWYPVRFTFNGNDSVRMYTEIDSGHYCYATAFEMTESDPAVQTILGTAGFDASKI